MKVPALKQGTKQGCDFRFPENKGKMSSTAPPDAASAAAAVALKDQGNAAYTAKDYASAIRLYSQGIELDPTNYILFSNRSVP